MGRKKLGQKEKRFFSPLSTFFVRAPLSERLELAKQVEFQINKKANEQLETAWTSFLYVCVQVKF